MVNEDPDEDLFQIGLFELCMALRETRTCASDPMPDGERRRIHSYLQRRLANWRASTLDDERAADDAARAYVVAALREDGVLEAGT